MASASRTRRTGKAQDRPRRRFRVMPLTMTMLALLFVLKLNDVYLNSRELREALSIREAQAADTPAAASAADAAKADTSGNTTTGNTTAPADATGNTTSNTTDTKASDATGNTTSNTTSSSDAAKPAKEEMTLGTGKTPVKDIEALKAKENSAPYTQDEMDLLQNLTKRRQELDQREQELDVKAKVLEATEKRIDDKIVAMKSLQAELGKVVAQYGQEQDKQIASLVKIYENMKPSDAAAVFNQLDMPILLEIISKMSERKVAPVLAGMDPKRARDVTQELAEMRRSHDASAGQAATAAAPAQP